MADTYLNVVDDSDAVVGQELRSVIHRDGLRHREVHVWFVTEDGQVIFQRRGATKDTYPNLLDATAGGHVEVDQSYEDAALAEVFEETGFDVEIDDLIPLMKVDITQIDRKNAVQNVVFRMVYLYPFDGDVADLQVEASDGAGFEVVDLDDILNEREEAVSQMVPGLFKEAYLPVWDMLASMVQQEKDI